MLREFLWDELRVKCVLALSGRDPVLVAAEPLGEEEEIATLFGYGGNNNEIQSAFFDAIFMPNLLA